MRYHSSYGSYVLDLEGRLYYPCYMFVSELVQKLEDAGLLMKNISMSYGGFVINIDDYTPTIYFMFDVHRGSIRSVTIKHRSTFNTISCNTEFGHINIDNMFSYIMGIDFVKERICS